MENCSSEIRGWRENFEITRTIHLNSERSEQFLITEWVFYLLQKVSHVYSRLQNRCKAGNKCKALKIWQKYMLILKKCCSVLQNEEITSNNKKLSTTHSTSLYSVYAVQSQEKIKQNRTQNFQKFRLSNTRMYFLEKL